MDKEKGVVIEEINMIEDSPEDIGQDLITETVFADAALGHRIIGTKESVAAIGRQDILSYVKARYTAGNMVISVAGNFDEASLMDLLEEAFGGLTSGKAARRLQTADHRPDWVARKKDIEQSHIFLGKRGVHLMSDDFYSYLLYSSILGGGMSSRLFQNVRENKGLAYSVYSVSSSFVEDGIFLIYAGVGLERERETLEAIRVETELLAGEGVGEDELQKVREQYKGHYIFGQENVSTRMFSTGRNMLLLGRTFGQEEVVAGVDAVSRADIAAIAAECADLSDYSGVLISGQEIPRGSVL
jgi:predicted Zn-dependent peptidase